jgi:RsiW-degrading membrane proteinase PrsW (M82 family)
VEYENGMLSLLHNTGAIAGLVEEPAKLAALLVISPVRKLIVDRKSGLYYATLCAFGFALIENIMYFQAYDGVLYIRANPAHAVFTSLWGAALGSWREGALQARGFAKYLLLGIGLHALWNFLASTDFTLFIVAFVATIWLGLSFIRRELGGKESALLTKMRL